MPHFDISTDCPMLGILGIFAMILIASSNSTKQKYSSFCRENSIILPTKGPFFNKTFPKQWLQSSDGGHTIFLHSAHSGMQNSPSFNFDSKFMSLKPILLKMSPQQTCYELILF